MTLVIREEQLPALREATFRDFVVRVTAHVQRSFPAHAAELGEALGGLVEYGVRRATHHGLKTRRQACKYVGLMCVAGRDFDKEDWAAGTLASTELAAGAKLVLLTATVLDRLGSEEQA